MKFASKNTFSLKNLKILGPQVTNILRICRKKFCDYGPGFFIVAI
jgi:hypothetical protein